MNNQVIEEQEMVCKKYGAIWVASPAELKVGIAKNVLTGMFPVNGLRHPPQMDTTGWYLWAGEEFFYAPDFFMPLCVEHLDEWCPLAFKFLGLPPGWRFLTDGEVEDVWYDESLLTV